MMPTMLYRAWFSEKCRVIFNALSISACCSTVGLWLCVNLMIEEYQLYWWYKRLYLINGDGNNITISIRIWYGLNIVWCSTGEHEYHAVMLWLIKWKNYLPVKVPDRKSLKQFASNSFASKLILRISIAPLCFDALGVKSKSRIYSWILRIMTIRLFQRLSIKICRPLPIFRPKMACARRHHGILKLAWYCDEIPRIWTGLDEWKIPHTDSQCCEWTKEGWEFYLSSIISYTLSCSGISYNYHSSLRCFPPIGIDTQGLLNPNQTIIYMIQNLMVALTCALICSFLPALEEKLAEKVERLSKINVTPVPKVIFILLKSSCLTGLIGL